MTSSTEWDKLRAKFKELHYQEGDVRAELAPVLTVDSLEAFKRDLESGRVLSKDEKDKVSNRWELRGYKINLPVAFNTLAELGAQYLGLGLNGQEAVEGWLNELTRWLQENKSGDIPTDETESSESVTIHQVYLMSAVFCIHWIAMEYEAIQVKSESHKIEKKRKRPPPYDVVMRRGVVQMTAVANPGFKDEGKLTRETCEALDYYKVGLPEKWKDDFDVLTWQEAYEKGDQKGRVLRHRIDSRFNDDRKSPLVELPSNKKT